MPQLTIPDSANIAILQTKVIADLCAGLFRINLSPSVFSGSGANNVQGAKIKIENPYGVIVRPYPSSGFDIVPPMTGTVTFSIPTESGNFQYGLYIITVELTDSTGKTYTVSNQVNICQPNLKDSTKKYGNISVSINGNCKKGMVTIMVNEPPVYKGKAYQSKTQSLLLTFPTGSGLDPVTTNVNAFSVPLFEGVHKVTGDVCATYNFGNETYILVPYKINCSKNILCVVDLCCVYNRMDQLSQELGDNCHRDDAKKITDTLLDAVLILKTIELGADCGEDVSSYIEELEKLLDCKCSCSASDGTAIVDSSPAANLSIVGCNVSKETVGLTDIYTINNYEYLVTTNPSNSFLTISSPSLTDCVKRQQLSFNVLSFYTELKSVVTNGINTESVYWATILNPQLNNLPDNLLACLGTNNTTWNALTFREKWLAILTKFCGCCAGGDCDAIISGVTTETQGNQELISWNNNSNVFAADVFIDGLFFETVLAPLHSVLVNFSASLDSIHSYKIISKCSNGALGNTLDGTFTNTGCDPIDAPSLSTNEVLDADCPYDLTSIVADPGAGFSLEWHNQNNRNPTSLVPNPEMVTSGNYYAFVIEDATKCSSPSSHVLIACEKIGNCTEPLNFSVTEGMGNSADIKFSSAATPPPSYLVKRRLASDPDVSGSYTNLGAPTFNSGINKWVLNDNTLATNTMYVYKAESQCADASRPFSVFTFARIVCPTIEDDRTNNSITYSFTHTGGSVDKYVVQLFDSTGSTLIQTKTHTPAFANPITDTFTGLTPNTVYRIRTTSFIGTYSRLCEEDNIPTLPSNVFVTLNNNVVGGVDFQLRKGGVLFSSGHVEYGTTFQDLSVDVPFGPSAVTLTVLGGKQISPIPQMLGSVADALSSGDTVATWNSISAPSTADFNFDIVIP